MDNFDYKKFLAEGKLHEAEDKDLQKLGEEMEKQLKAAGLDTKVFGGEDAVPNNAKAQIAKNPKLAALAYTKTPGLGGKMDEILEVIVPYGSLEDLQKIASSLGIEKRELVAMEGGELVRIKLSRTLSESLNEAMSPQDVVDIADTVAEEFTKESAEEGDFLVYSVGRMEGMGFELDTDLTSQSPKGIDMRGVGEGWGGIFRIKPTEDGYEVRNAEKGGLVAIIDGAGNFKMLSADESKAEMGMDDELDMDRYNDELDMDRYNDELDMDRMEESEMLDEGLINKIKEKIVAKVDKIKSKFSDEEIAKMKAVAEKAIGKSAEDVTMADFTMDNIKKVGKAISALNEEEQIEEGLGEKIQGLGAGLGLPAMFVGGHMAMASAAGGVEAFIAGAIALVVGLIGGAIVKSMDEAQEAPKSNKMKKSELKEMIRAAMLAEAEKDEEVADEIELEDTEEVDVEMDADMEGGSEVDGIDVKQDADAELGGVKGDVQDNLEAALEAAKKLGDDKLVDQIGNSLTFFTRQHVVKEGDMIEDEAEMELEEAKDEEVKENLNESIEFPMWNKIK